MLKKNLIAVLTLASLLGAMNAEAATLKINFEPSIPTAANLNITYSYQDGSQQQSATMNDFQRSEFNPWLQAFNSDIAKLANLGSTAKLSLGYMANGKAINPTTCQAMPLKATTTIEFSATGCTAF